MASAAATPVPVVSSAIRRSAALDIAKIQPRVAFDIARLKLSIRFKSFEETHNYALAEKQSDAKIVAIIKANTAAARNKSKSDGSGSGGGSGGDASLITTRSEFDSLSSVAPDRKHTHSKRHAKSSADISGEETLSDQAKYMEFLMFRAMSRHGLKLFTKATTDYDALISAIGWKEKQSSTPAAVFYYAYLLRAQCAVQMEQKVAAAAVAAATAKPTAAASASGGGDVTSGGDIKSQLEEHRANATRDVQTFIARITDIDETDAEHTHSGGGETEYEDRGMIGSKMVHDADFREVAQVCEVLGMWYEASGLWTRVVEWEDSLPEATRQKYQLRRARANVESLMRQLLPPGGGVAERTVEMTEQIFSDCASLSSGAGGENNKEALLLVAYANFLCQKPREAHWTRSRNDSAVS